MVEEEQEAAGRVLSKHEEERARLQDQEERYWREYCTHKAQLSTMEDENRRLGLFHVLLVFNLLFNIRLNALLQFFVIIKRPHGSSDSDDQDGSSVNLL